MNTPMTTSARGPLAAVIGGLTVVVGLVALTARRSVPGQSRGARAEGTTTVEQKLGAVTIAWTVLAVLAGMATFVGACMLVAAVIFGDRLVWTQLPVVGGLLVLFGGLIWFGAGVFAYYSAKDGVRASGGR